MHKAPRRKQADVTQPFNDGILTIYTQTDTAAPGYAPVSKLTQKAVLRYEELRLGLQRYYAARQSQVQIKRVLRCPRMGNVSTQDIAQTQDGARYCIEMVQTAPGVFPPSMDLTLSEITPLYGGAP